MAEEHVNSNNNDNNDGDQKHSTKMFTQSEFDQHIARERKKIEEKYKDYDTLKTQLEELMKEKKERELAKKSEVEKRDIQIQELTQKLTKIETEYLTEKKKNLRNEILSDPKFSVLPKAYKNLVKISDNLEEIKESAEEALKEYEKDFGKKRESFGSPLLKQNANNNDGPKNMAEMIKQKLMNRGLKKEI